LYSNDIECRINDPEFLLNLVFEIRVHFENRHQVSVLKTLCKRLHKDNEKLKPVLPEGVLLDIKNDNLI